MIREAAVTLEDLDRLEEKKAKARETNKAREGKEKAAFVIERDDTGLFYVRLDGTGQLPELLQGKRYTSKFYLEQDLLQVKKDAKGEERKTIFKT